jgi:HEAT repeat protein
MRLWIFTALAIGLLATHAFAETPAKEVTVADRVTQAKNVNEESEKRIKAIDALGSITEKDVLDNHVIDALVEVAKNDPDPFVRVSGIKTLGVIERNVTHAHNAKTAYLEPFTEIMKRSDDYPPVRVAVANVFRETLIPTELKDRDVAFKAMVDLVNNKDSKTKSDTYGLKLECIAAIGNFGSPQSLDVLMNLLNDPDPIVKETVAKAIYTLLNKTSESANSVTFATVKKLVDIMEDTKTPVDLRIGVMFALAKLIRAGSLEAAKAIDSIVNLRKTTPDNTEGNLLVLNSIEALGIIGATIAVEPLQKIYETYYDKDKVSDPVLLKYRRASIKAFENVLKTQGIKKSPDAAASSTIAALLVRAIENKPAWAEAAEVRGDAIFAVRYFMYKPYEKEQANAYGALIDVIKDSKDDLKAKALDTLDAVTQLGSVFKDDVRRWVEWYENRYGKRPEKK